MFNIIAVLSCVSVGILLNRLFCVLRSNPVNNSDVAADVCVTWDAMDLSTQPACHVKLRATFDEKEHVDEFCAILKVLLT